MARKKNDKGGLGFRFSKADEWAVDYDEYRALFASGKLTPQEMQWMKQFLFERYGKPVLEDLQLHTHEQYLENNREAYRRAQDVTHPQASPPKPRKKQGRHVYSPEDYGDTDYLDPEQRLLELEEQGVNVFKKREQED